MRSLPIRPPPADDLGDALGCSSRVLVFPDAYDLPPRPRQAGVGVAVTLSILFDLGPPPVCVRLRPGSMVWTAVPKAAVHEDGDLRPRKHQVCLPPGVGIRSDMQAKPQPHMVQTRSQHNLGLGITGALTTHPDRDRR
jgi:hypothetical protein